MIDLLLLLATHKLATGGFSLCRHELVDDDWQLGAELSIKEQMSRALVRAGERSGAILISAT
jgi:hypothetical protein